MRTVALGDVCDVIMGQAPPGATYNDQGVGLPLIAGASDFGFVSPQPSRFTSAPTQTAAYGDIILCIRATIGDLNFADREYCLGRGVAGIRPRSTHVDRNFIWWTLQANANVLSSRGRGATFKQVNRADIESLEIVLPPLDEQRRIAAILDQADDLRRKRREAAAQLERVYDSVFREIIGDWSRPGYNGTLFELGEKLDFLTSGSRGWAEYYRQEGDLFIRIQNVKRDELDLSEIAFVEPPKTAEAVRTRVEPGDVLLSITADLGRTAVIPDNIGNAYINQHLSILRSSQLNSRFLSAAIASSAGQMEIQRKNREGVKAGINFDDIRTLRLPNVDRSTQDQFAARVAEIDALKAHHRAHLAKLDTLFASLQHRAFQGEL